MKRIGALAMGLAWFLGQSAQAQTTVTDVGQFSGTGHYYSVYAFGNVNSFGQVSGYGKDITFTDTAFRWSKSTGIFEELYPLGGPFTFLYCYGQDINDSGTVVGFVAASYSYDEHIVYWDSAGVIHDLFTLSGGFGARGWGINDLGEITGESDTASGSRHAVYWDGMSLNDLGVPAGYSKSAGADINNAGTIAGHAEDAQGIRVAHKFSAGTWQSLGLLDGYSNSQSVRINSAGNVCGFAKEGNTTMAFFHDGTMHAIGTFGGSKSTAYGINNLDFVVGTATNAAGESRAFLWKNGHLVNLNDILPMGSPWTLWSATGINDSNEICGWGYRADIDDFHSFLLVPGAFLVGKVGLNLFAGDPTGLGAMLELRAPGTTNVLYNYPIALDAQGQYLVPEIATGTFDLAVKFDHFLRKVIPSVTLATGYNEADFTVVNGDANSDNSVDLMDLNAILLNFGLTSSADLDGVAPVSISDLNIVLINFGSAGPN